MDIQCGGTSEILWRDTPFGGEATDYGTSVYTEGDCWLLAWEVKERFLEDGIDSRVLVFNWDSDPNGYSHVAVEIEGSYVDITGVHSSVKDLTKIWGGSIRHIPEDVTYEEYAKMMDGGLPLLAHPEETKKVSRELANLYYGF